MAKRRNGDGSVYLRGRIWWIAYYVDGQQVNESSKSTSKDVALHLLNKRKVTVGEGHGSSLTGHKFKTVANEWLEYEEALEVHADSTLHGWRIAINGHFLPLWEDLYMHQMTEPSLYEDYIAVKLSGKRLNGGKILVAGNAKSGKLSPSSISHHLTALSKIFAWAQRRNKAITNPVALADKSALHKAMKNDREDNPAEPFEAAEIELITAQMSKADDRFFVHTLASLGMRIGEAMALQLSAYDPVAKTLEVGPSVKRDAKGAQFLETRRYRRKGKTASGFRLLGLSDHYAEMLDAHIARMKEEGRIPDKGKQFIFPNTKGNLKQVGNWRRRIWNPAVVAAGLYDPDVDDDEKSTPHKLRHTYASAQIAEGTPVSDLSYRMGHKNPQVTLSIYTHIFKSQGQEIADNSERYATTPADSDLELAAA